MRPEGSEGSCPSRSGLSRRGATPRRHRLGLSLRGGPVDDARRRNELHRPRAGHQRGGGRRLDVRRERDCPDRRIVRYRRRSHRRARSHWSMGGVDIDSITDGLGGASPPAAEPHVRHDAAELRPSTSISYAGRRHRSGGDVRQRCWRSRCRIGEDRGHVYQLQPERRPPGEHFAVGRSDWGKRSRARVRLDSGTLPSGYMQLHASSTGFLRKRPRDGADRRVVGRPDDDSGLAQLCDHRLQPYYSTIQVGVQIGVGGGHAKGASPDAGPLDVPHRLDHRPVTSLAYGSAWPATLSICLRRA